MSRLCRISCTFLTGLLLVGAAFAQSDEISLGDLARNLRKHQAPPRAVIDNDNLSDVMEKGETRRWANSRPPSDSAAAALVNPPAPDVTCALSFNGQKDGVRDLHPERLPDSEVGKLDGPGTIVGDSLQLSIHNGSSWDLREITVGLTLVQRPEPAYHEIDGFRLLPATLNSSAQSEKHRETTILYHLKGSAAPAATTLFQAPLNATIGPDQEWHWAIVQAKGIPPASAPDSPLTAAPGLIQAPN